MVHSLVLLEAGLLDVASGPALCERLGPAIQLYAAGKKEEAVDAFLSVVIGAAYRDHLDALIPGGFEQAVADADAFFAVELASLGEWRLAEEDARRITQPTLAVFGADSVHDWVGWAEVQARVKNWMPHAEVFVLAGANHMLQEKDPRGVAEAMAPFLASHPMPTRVRSG
jgi:3-oxoadipate enol-lactonase